MLVRGTQNVLIDSAASASDVDNYIVPALKKLGMSLSDIHYLACTPVSYTHLDVYKRQPMASAIIHMEFAVVMEVQPPQMPQLCWMRPL